MGYNYWVTGEIRIEPPLNWTEFRKVHAEGIFPVALAIVTEDIESDEGTLTRRYVTAIVPEEQGKYRAGGLLQAVQTIVSACPGHEYTGYLEVTSAEEPIPPYRVHVVDGQAQQLDPIITWPGDPS